MVNGGIMVNTKILNQSRRRNQYIILIILVSKNKVQYDSMHA